MININHIYIQFELCHYATKDITLFKTNVFSLQYAGKPTIIIFHDTFTFKTFDISFLMMVEKDNNLK